jgi:protein involved in sex pheromone biosynthesis
MHRNNKLVFTILNCLLLSGCVTVKEYQKSKINDAEMELSNRKVEKFETSFYLYREGASGANGGKSSGGCGCN